MKVVDHSSNLRRKWSGVQSINYLCKTEKSWLNWNWVLFRFSTVLMKTYNIGRNGGRNKHFTKNELITGLTPNQFLLNIIITECLIFQDLIKHDYLIVNKWQLPKIREGIFGRRIPAFKRISLIGWEEAASISFTFWFLALGVINFWFRNITSANT